MNGFCTITVSGAPVKLRFGLPANRNFFNYMANNPGILVGNDLTETGVAALLEAAYINQCMLVDEVPELKFGDFLQYTEDAYIDNKLNQEMLAAVECWQESNHTVKYTEDVRRKLEGAENKKKVAGKKRQIGKK